MLDYYKILNVANDASFEEIKRSYRRYAKIYHPDVNSDRDSKLMFQLINEAYQTLANTGSRRIYDFRINKRADQYKRFGASVRNKGYDPAPDNFREKKTQASAKTEEKEYTFFIKQQQFDRILFLSMVIVGILGVIFGVLDLIYKPRNGLDNFSGILFSIFFLFWLIYGWQLRKKDNHNTGINDY